MYQVFDRAEPAEINKFQLQIADLILGSYFHQTGRDLLRTAESGEPAATSLTTHHLSFLPMTQRRKVSTRPTTGNQL